MTSYTNIPSNSLKLVSKQDFKSKATVRVLLSARVVFTKFALIQFIHGFKPDSKSDNFASALLMQKVAKQVLLSLANPEHPDVEVDYTVEELTMLRKWLENRMAHCELERDSGSNTFNPDTYIGQKLLLIDLRELLLGTILEVY